MAQRRAADGRRAARRGAQAARRHRPRLLVPGEVAARDQGHVLAVPNSSPLVPQLFQGVDWGGSPGAGGPCKDALRQAPAEIVIHDKNVNRIRIGGVQQRCNLVVWKNFRGAPER
jgi:hypothetical protein